MIHEEDDKWVGDFNAYIKQTHPDLKAELKKLEGEEIFTRDDVKNIMTVSRKELLERIAALEKENSDLRAQLGRVTKGELRLETVKKRILSKLLNAGYFEDGPAYKIIEEEIKVKPGMWTN